MIPVFRPSVGKEEFEAVKEVLLSGWIGLGPKTSLFEKKFSEFIDSPYCVGLNSGTAALDMAMKLLGIGEGDEVIVPTITFVSTAHAVCYNGGTPIFADCDDTLGIDLEDVRKKLTSKTKAVIVVHYGGRPIDLDKLKEIVGDIPIVEDCAHASGSYYKGKHVGSSNIGCFSFHAVKNLAMGEGGLISLQDKDMYERAKKLRWLGIDKGTWDRVDGDRSYWWEYSVDEIGLKSHLNDIHAAIGIVQLAKIKEMNSIRKHIAMMYSRCLHDVIRIPESDDKDFQSSWHLYEIEADRRDDLSVFLKDNGINTGVHYKPIHMYSCYKQDISLPVAEAKFKKILTLPIFPDLGAGQEYIIDKVREFYGS